MIIIFFILNKQKLYINGIKINSNIKMKIRNSNFFVDPKSLIYSIEYKNLKKIRLKYFHFFYKKLIKVNFIIII